MSDRLTSIPNHPAEKSLHVFPIISQEKSGIIQKHSQKSNQNGSENQKTTRIELNRIQEGNEQREGVRRNIQKTKAKLERASKQFCRTQSSLVQLPRIKQKSRLKVATGKRQMTHEENWKGYRAFVLPDVHQERCSCSCDRVSPKNLQDRKMPDKLPPPEETPPLLSVYVRWRNYRHEILQYNVTTLYEMFRNFGDISNILFKSSNSAVVVFKQIESAGNAAKVMQKVGKDIKLNVRWMNGHQ